MSEDGRPKELSLGDLQFHVSAEQFSFRSTRELEPLDEVVGQPRALRALDLGLGVRHPNYHIYAAGMTGTSRMDILAHAVHERIRDESVPPDWMYVNNFDEPDCPLAISLPAGQGTRFKEDMDNLIDHLREALPQAFRQEDFDKEKERLRQHYQQRGREMFQELDNLARQYQMTVQQRDGHILFVPLKDGRPMTNEEMEQLSADEIRKLEQHQEDLTEKAQQVLRQQQKIEQELSQDVREVARQFASRIVDPVIEELTNKYETPKLQQWLQRVRNHILDHLDRFREGGSGGGASGWPPALAAAMGGGGGSDEQRFLDYRVNLLVDNSQQHRPPIIIEGTPNYRNLFGTIERTVDPSGRVISSFSRIKSGSLLKASGGYVIFNMMDALLEPFVWKELKRTLKRGSVEIETYDPFSLYSVTALKPEPIPLQTKLMVVGPPLLYHMLYLYDEDFREIFRVKADFDREMSYNEHAGQTYGRFVRKLSDTENLLPFDADGVAQLVQAGARMARHRDKISTQFTNVANLIREADFWARQAGAEEVTGDHVQQAVREQVYRSDLIAEKIRELIAEGTLLISLDERRVGQVNALSVANLGDYAFGRPSRVTASVGVGAAGLINIERESRLSGQTYDKGMLILEGYLRNKYAREQSLSLSASLAMEQSYGGVDGDSASAAELLCLLSALAEVPLRQDVALTGSINQWGEIQAIGGANEKIEGFFDVCREHGLSGQQGVCIPQANVKNLLLRSDVVGEIEKGRFHIWPVRYIDEIIALLSGLSPGDRGDEQTFHGRVHNRLQEMASALQKQKTVSPERWLSISDGPGPSRDPRPPLPGRDEGNGS